jgi:hypothetical protein
MRLRLRLFPYCIARQNFKKGLKIKQMLKLSFSFDCVRFIQYSWKYELNGLKYVSFCVIFHILTMFNIICRTRAVGAGAASRYGSGSNAAPCDSGSGSATLLSLHHTLHWKMKAIAVLITVKNWHSLHGTVILKTFVFHIKFIILV